MPSTQPPVPHAWVAERLGVTLSHVSYLRSGARTGRTFNTMQRVRAAFDWPVGEQAEAHASGHWLEAFERVIAEAYAQDTAGKDTA